MHKKINRTHQACCVAVLAISAGGVKAEPEAMVQGLEEVVVTAQKREEFLQQTPISMTAFSADQLAQMGASRAIDIAQYTPNISIVANTISNSGLAVSIRGMQSSDASLAADSKIGLYLDGVYLARIGSASFDVVDIEQIEVLRGPQGTLWGKNTTGGSINMVTEKPSGQFRFKQVLSLGNFDYWRSNTTVDTPEWHGLAAKFSFNRMRKDGDVENTHPSSSTLGEMDNEAYAIALRWTPTDEFTADYSYDRHNRDGVGPSLQLSAVNPGLAARPTAWLTGAGGLRPIANPFHAAAAEVDGHRRTHLSVNARQEHIDLAGHNLTLSYELGDIELKSVTGYRTYDGIKPADFDGGTYSIPIFEADNFETHTQFSQELQVVGSALDDRLSYVAGLYYFMENGEAENPQTFAVAAGTLPSGERILASVTTPLRYTTHNYSAAAYSQASYTPVFDDKLRLTLGLRYTRDHKQSKLVTRGAEAEHEWSAVNPAFIVDYQLLDDMNLYGKVTTGYNAGVFNIRATSAALFNEPADEENLTNYEVGMKSEWLDRRLRVNTSLFWMDYEDLQVNQFVASATGASSIISNAGKARVRGLELEVMARPIPELTVSANWGYTDFDYQEFITSIDQVTGIAVDSADSAKPALAPKNTANIGVEYQFQPWSFGALSARVDASYSDSYDFHPFLTRYTHADSRTLYNARLTLADVAVAQGVLSVSAWGKNLTDEEYIANGIDFGVDSGSLGFAGVIYGPRRSYGVDLTYRYE